MMRKRRTPTILICAGTSAWRIVHNLILCGNNTSNNNLHLESYTWRKSSWLLVTLLDPLEHNLGASRHLNSLEIAIELVIFNQQTATPHLLVEILHF